MIKFDNCDNETLVKKLTGNLSIYPQIPQIQTNFYSKIDVISREDEIVTIGTKPNNGSPGEKTVFYPLGHLNEELLLAIKENVFGYRNILLSGWDNLDHYKGSSCMIIRELIENKNVELVPIEIDFLTQNPQEYPDNPSGKNKEWLRKALNKKDKYGIDIKKLNEESCFDISYLYSKWLTYKEKPENSKKLEYLLNIFDTYKNHDIQIYGAYQGDNLLAVNGVALYGEKAVQLVRNYVPSKIPAQKILDDYVFHALKNNNINSLSVGNSKTQTENLLYYKERFLPIKAKRRFNYYIKIK